MGTSPTPRRGRLPLPALFAGLRAAAFATAAFLAVAKSTGGEMRLWTSADGKTVTAELVDATETTVTIKNDAGREFVLAHERLSAADREYVLAHVAAKKAEIESLEWPSPTAERSIKAAYFKRLHAVDSKRFAATYAGKVLLIEGQVIDVKEDRMSSSQGVLVTIETEDRMPIEFRFSKAGYDKDLTLLLGVNYNRYRGPWGEDEFRVGVADKSIVVERRFVISRDSDYTGVGWRYRNRWSSWQVVAKPVARGETVKIRGEFVSAFNSLLTFKDATLVDPVGTIDGSVVR